MTPEKHFLKIAEWFSRLGFHKYMAGQAEHGGRLWRKPVWKLIRDEIIDLPIYFQVLEEQQEALLVELEEAKKYAKKYGENIGCNLHIERAINIVEYGNPEGISEEEL